MTTITQVITPLPTAPDPAVDTAPVFSTKAAASVLAQKAMVPELNTMTEQMNTVAGEVNANAIAVAANTATTTANTGTTTSNTATATAAAATATTKAGEASASAAAALASEIAAAASAGANTTVQAQIVAAATKTSPVDADNFGFTDSAASHVLKKFTWANFKSNFLSVVQGTANRFTKAQQGAFSDLSDAATVAIDLSLANQYRLGLGGNRTLGVPTNIVEGQQGIINVYQDPTGSRTLAYAWVYQWAGGVAASLSTPGCTRDMLAYSVDIYKQATMTVTIATPGVVTMTAHGLINGQKVQITTTGALPTGLVANTTYFVRTIDANSFSLCTTLANAAANTRIATSGTQSGVHTLTACSITMSIGKAVA